MCVYARCYVPCGVVVATGLALKGGFTRMGMRE